ncbi:MAG: choloylglycine hydrolase [Clostridium sp.]|uniref:choloylglycine hydrolase n=1 Tax=Clostridium sp. TaxID=1506 RepID=UPI0030568AE3
MCTGLTLSTKDGHHLFGRSMDIPFGFNQGVHIVPRNYIWTNHVTSESMKTKHAILGMSSIIDNHPMFADGMNEKGLTCAGLYFANFAEYEKKSINGKFNIGPYDFILWTLSNFENLEELKEGLKNLNLVDEPFSPAVPIPLLHWICSDKSGKSIVIEKVKNKLNIFDNPVGVLTNSPDFKWHLYNLHQYIGINPMQPKDLKWGDLDLFPFGQGLGAFGIPGDFTPASRFVKASFLKNHISDIDNEVNGVAGFFHILSSCDIPRGTVLSTEGHKDTTIYTAAMCSESGTYYYHTYSNRQITAINLFKEDLDMDKIKSYPYRETQSLFCEN